VDPVSVSVSEVADFSVDSSELGAAVLARAPVDRDPVDRVPVERDPVDLAWRGFRGVATANPSDGG